MEHQAVFAIAIFLIAYGMIIVEKVHRTIVAMLGGIAVVAFGIVDVDAAIAKYIDFNTLGLLIGMMIIVGVTAKTGLFSYVATVAAKRAKGEPIRIMLALAIITAVASAFLDNVTTVLLIVPVSFSLARQLQVHPYPFLFTQILASNIGGTATLIGDPPNIMIGSAVKELTFMAFINNLAPIIALVMAVHLPLFVLLFRGGLRTTETRKREVMAIDEQVLITDRPLLMRCLVILGLTVAGFFLHGLIHVESSVVALAGAFLLLVLEGEHVMEEAFSRVEWATIFFFVGLFTLVGALVETGIVRDLAERAIDLTGGNVAATAMLVLWMSAIFSAFMDNIPFVATMIPLIQEMGNMGVHNLEPIWWSLALGACLGGNGTLIGASANLITAGLAAKEGYPITFWRFMKLAFPLMLLSVAICSVYIYLRYL
ncbi:ArsB/NhaD family transporter [Cohnella yongneupensis]|uniref:ArsB/NhaD family transporter n=1 Tax=Cohnella yongneupensis TaxID=425006 RepID=A0ABW0R1L3_9BACL